MTQKIRDCLTVAEFTPIDFSALGWESRMPREALLTYDFGDVLQRLVERILTVSPAGHRATMLVGPPGSGKSFLSKLLLALARTSETPLQEGSKRLRDIQAGLVGKKYLTLELSSNDLQVSDATQPALDFIGRYITYALSTAGRVESNRNETVRAIIRAFDGVPEDVTVLVVFDCFDDWFRSNPGKNANVIIELLQVLSEVSKQKNLAILATSTDTTLDPNTKRYLSTEQVGTLLNAFSLEYLNGDAIPALVGAHLLSKNARQRHGISVVGEQLRNKLPELKLDEQKLINLYPLHPAVWEIGSRLRQYLGGFSFPGFAVKVGEKIRNRPAESLFTVDEMLDFLDPKLRSVPQLAYAFESYDQAVEGVLPKVSQGQRLHTRMLLKAMLMHSLAGIPATVRDLTNSILFYDLYGNKQTYALSGALLQQIKSLARGVIVTGTEPSTREYRFALQPSDAITNVVDAQARGISDNDPRINVTLAAAGSLLYEDFPIGFGAEGDDKLWNICFTHLWHVTMHDATGFVWQPAQSDSVSRNGKEYLTRLHFPRRVGQADFDIESLREGESFVNWLPGALDSDDLWVLKRLACLADPLLFGSGMDETLRETLEELELKGSEIFRRKYLIEGRFVFRNGSVSDVPTPSGPSPWQLWDWFLPLTSPVTPDGYVEALSAETAQWIGHLVAPEREKVEMCVPDDLEGALAGLGAYYQAWRQNDISRAIQCLAEAPESEVAIQEALSVVRQFEMATFHVRHALTHKSVAEEVEEIILLFDSDPDAFWRARKMLDEIYQFNGALKSCEAKLRYISESFPTSNSSAERIRQSFRLHNAPSWVLFYPHNRRHVDLSFGAYQPIYSEFYSLLHAGATQGSVIEPLCSRLVSSPDWRNLELISQLGVSRQDYLVDAINEISSMYQMICSEPVEEILLGSPRCRCGFSPAQGDSLLAAEGRVRDLIRRGIDIHRDLLREKREDIREKLKQHRQNVNPDTIRSIAAMVNTQEMPVLTDDVVRVINDLLAE